MKNVFVSQETLTALASVPFLNEQQVATLTEKAEFLRSFNRIDDNPFDIPGDLVACGPTTGYWMSANRLKWWGEVKVDGVWFTLAVGDPDADD